MPLRKSPERTPAFLAAHRANVRKSTGPRTAEGKARGRLNALKHGGRSALLTGFIHSLGLPPRVIKPLCTTTRAPFERIGPVQMSLLRWWLAREWGPDSHRFYQFLRKAAEQERQAAAGVLQHSFLEAARDALFRAEFLARWEQARKAGVPPTQPAHPEPHPWEVPPEPELATVGLPGQGAKSTAPDGPRRRGMTNELGMHLVMRHLDSRRVELTGKDCDK
jgi:hypothetical protein